MPRHIYDEDHDAFRATVREFVERTLKPRAEEMVRDKSIARDIWQAAGKQGLFGFGIPEEYGGAGSDDYRFNAVAAEEVAAFSAAVSSCFGIHSDVIPPYIVDLGTDEQKQRWLPGMASGDLISAIAMTEPSGGSDLAALKTTAVRPTTARATGSSTAARRSSPTATPPTWSSSRPGPTRPRVPGHHAVRHRGRDARPARGRKLDKVGQDESDTAELFFENVRVSDANRLGDEGMGFVAMMQRCPGADRWGGRQHGERGPDPPRDDRVRQGPQGLRPADRDVSAQQVQAGGARHHGRGHPGVRRRLHHRPRAGRLTAVDAAKAKWWSAQVQNDVLDECVQLYGGYGYMNEYRVAALGAMRASRRSGPVQRDHEAHRPRPGALASGRHRHAEASAGGAPAAEVLPTARPPRTGCHPARNGEPGARHTQTPGERRWAVSFRDELIGGS